MIKNAIKIYARIRSNENAETTIDYELLSKETHEDIIISLPHDQRHIIQKCNGYNKFRFHKVFDRESTQAELFDVIAKPVVNSVLDGYNGTIFAYGQTGSGKTYSITGSQHNYNNRGIIPRSLEQIFEHINKNLEMHAIFISYLEIYNEIGYDLLNYKKNVSSLEDLPRVTLLEDSKGEGHLRNLSIVPVANVEEAMKLLYIGDKNRTIAETPMNDFSSRSHCIFTVYVAFKDLKKKKRIRRSKLHLVDLAGSERLTKSNRTLITEARHINLSLHYLEQVILALSENNRSHIPFRNSMMTFILKDSLAGNSLTAMLATLSANFKNIEECLTTCKFAQRVSLVYTNATINEEEVDPQEEIIALKAEIADLKKRIKFLTGNQNRESLTIHEIITCKNKVENFIHNENADLVLNLDVIQIKECFKIFREKLLEKSTNNYNDATKYVDLKKNSNNKCDFFDKNNFTNLQVSNNFKESTYLFQEMPDLHLKDDVTHIESHYQFIKHNETYSKYKNCETMLKKQQNFLKIMSSKIQICENNIAKMRNKLKQINNCEKSNLINQQLLKQQTIYDEAIRELKVINSNVSSLNYNLMEAKYKLKEEFKHWRGEPYNLKDLNLVTSTKQKSNNAWNKSNCKIYAQDYQNENNLFPTYYKSDFNNKTDIINIGIAHTFADPFCNTKKEDKEFIADFLDYKNNSNFSNSKEVYKIEDKEEGNYLRLYDSRKVNQYDKISLSSSPKKYKDCSFGNINKISKDKDSFASTRVKLVNNVIPEIGFSDTATKQEMTEQYNVKTAGCKLRPDSYIDYYKSNNSLDFKNSQAENYKYNLNPSTPRNLTSIQFIPVRDIPTPQTLSSNTPEHTTNEYEATNENFYTFIKGVPLTGDPDVDDEIVKFYKSKFNIK